MILASGAIDLRLGDWREVLADVEKARARLAKGHAVDMFANAPTAQQEPVR